MAYVEWLRVRKMLRVWGIILAIGFLLAIAGRIALQIAIERYPGHAQLGGDSSFVDLSGYFVVSILAGLVAATILGAPLAKENSGHAEIAWTKPISRGSLALRIFAVDIGGIIVTQVLAVIAEIICGALFQAQDITLSPAGMLFIAVSLAGPIAWYAFLTAATASMKQGFGVILGLAWPVGIGVPFLALIQNPHNPIIQALHGIMLALEAIDPLTYLNPVTIFMVPTMGSSGTQMSAGLGGFGALAALAILYGALAIVQWRRLET